MGRIRLAQSAYVHFLGQGVDYRISGPRCTFCTLFLLSSFLSVLSFFVFFRLGGELGMGLEEKRKKHGRMKGKCEEGYGRSYH